MRPCGRLADRLRRPLFDTSVRQGADILCVNTRGMRIHRTGQIIVNVSDAVAAWGAGYRWLKFFEIYDCWLDQSAQRKIEEACAVRPSMLRMTSPERLLTDPPADTADSTLAIVEGFAAMSPRRQNALVHRINRGSFYGSWWRHLGDGPTVGVSVAGLVRLKVGGQYVLMEQHGVFIPVGGVHTYLNHRDRAELERMGAFGFLEDTDTPDFTQDLRFLLPKRRLQRFCDWLFEQLARRVNRRIESDPVRELKEEFVSELQVFTEPEFNVLLRPPVRHSEVRHAMSAAFAAIFSDLPLAERCEHVKNLGVDGSDQVVGKLGWALDVAEPDIRATALGVIGPRLLHSECLINGLGLPYVGALLAHHGKDSSPQEFRDLTAQAIARMLRDVPVEQSDLLSGRLWASARKCEVVGVDYRYDPDLKRDDGSWIAVVAKRMHSRKQDVLNENLPRERPDLIGRESWRPYYTGRVIFTPLAVDAIDESATEKAYDVIEPYDVAFGSNSVLIAGADTIMEIDVPTAQIASIRSDWFAQLHALDVSADGNRLLVASSGFDALIEIDGKSHEHLWRWFAFEHMQFDPTMRFRATRSEGEAQALAASGLTTLVISEPKTWTGYGMPTQYRTHINDARFLDGETVMATSAHAGTCFLIDRSTGDTVLHVAGLQAPHGFCRMAPGRFAVADTRRGRIVFTNRDGTLYKAVYLGQLADQSTKKRDGVEWTQNVSRIDSDVVLVVDDPRNRIWIIDVPGRRYRGISIPDGWRIHQVRPVPARIRL